MATKKIKDVEIERSGEKIILPALPKPMTTQVAIDTLMAMRKQEDEVVNVVHEIECSPIDGMVSFMRALKEKFGWTGVAATPPQGFFDPGHPPLMIAVPIGPKETLQVPYNTRIIFPALNGGYIELGLKPEPQPALFLKATVHGSEREIIDDLAALTKKFVAERSIYKGKAVKLSFQWQRDEEDYDPTHHAPQFLELDGVNEGDLILSEETELGLQEGLFTPIEYATHLKELGIPLKRTVLLAGEYGTGKTMTAHVTALKALRQGFTFIMLESAEDLTQGIEFARRYGPAVVSVEDTDRVTDGDRTLELDKISHLMDGIDTKDVQLITMFTTNHPERINKVLLRPGRVDTYVVFTRPDAQAALRFVKVYGRGLLEKDGEGWTHIGPALAGLLPAFIREVVERAKLHAIRRLTSPKIKGHVTEEDLLHAVKALKPHIELLEAKPQKRLATGRLLLEVPSDTDIEALMEQTSEVLQLSGGNGYREEDGGEGN